MPTVLDTIESSIERMTGEADALRAQAVKLDSDIQQHYIFLGRRYYDERRSARVTNAAR
jgi:hypothetical protein